MQSYRNKGIEDQPIQIREDRYWLILKARPTFSCKLLLKS